jgi:type IV secretion system protein VirB10
MTVATPVSQGPAVVTDIRAKEPKAKGLPSRQALLAGALVLGGFVAFAILNGMSERPRRFQASEPQAEPHAATLPETVRAAPSTYDNADFAAAIEPPVDPFWGPNGPPPEYAPEQAVPPPPVMPAAVSAPDPALEERNAARASPLLLTARTTPSAGGSAFVHPARLEAPAGRTILQAGAVIPAALQTGVNSDIPGQVTALVTAPVYDSLTGAHLLIPQGARLIGAIQNGVTYGDRRLRIVWTRLILPNGWSMDLGELEASDVSGAAGLPADVDNQLGRMAMASVVSGALSTSANAAEDNETSVFGQSVGNAAAQEAARVGGRIVDRELNVRPTLRVPAGAPVRVIVSRDLVLREYRP